MAAIPRAAQQNPHTHHVHISVKSDKVHYDSTATWPLDGVAAPAPGHVAEIKRPTLRLGATEDAVKELQKLLGLAPDGNFSAATVAAVKKKQESANIVADGIVGPQTWAIL